MSAGTLKRPHRRKAPKIETAPEPRMTELIGLTDDGRMILWDNGMVQPVSRFETIERGRWIESGHYVIDWKGHAITVHCGNYVNGDVSVLFMCSRGDSIAMSRPAVEALLLGKVIPDPVIQAKISRSLKQLLDMLVDQQDVPHRQRGRIG